MTDGFIADVVSNNNDGTWTVTPRIMEHDGTIHPNILVAAVEGITPSAGDSVLILTIKNNIDNSIVKRFYKSSEANGRIIAVVTAPSGFVLTGNFKFVGNLEITGDLTVDGNLTVKKDLTVNGNSTVSKNLTVSQSLTVTNNASVGSLTVNNKDWLLHTHGGVMPGTSSTTAGTQL